MIIKVVVPVHVCSVCEGLWIELQGRQGKFLAVLHQGGVYGVASIDYGIGVQGSQFCKINAIWLLQDCDVLFLDAAVEDLVSEAGAEVCGGGVVVKGEDYFTVGEYDLDENAQELFVKTDDDSTEKFYIKRKDLIYIFSDGCRFYFTKN